MCCPTRGMGPTGLDISSARSSSTRRRSAATSAAAASMAPAAPAERGRAARASVRSACSTATSSMLSSILYVQFILNLRKRKNIWSCKRRYPNGRNPSLRAPVGTTGGSKRQDARTPGILWFLSRSPGVLALQNLGSDALEDVEILADVEAQLGDERVQNGLAQAEQRLQAV